jgi:hypothetical protein
MVSGRTHSGNFIRIRRKKARFCITNTVFDPHKGVFLDAF